MRIPYASIRLAIRGKPDHSLVTLIYFGCTVVHRVSLGCLFP